MKDLIRVALIISLFVFTTWILIPSSLNGCESEEIEAVDNSLNNKVLEAKAYTEEHSMNTDVCIFVDMSIHSGRKRLVLWDIPGDSAILAGLVSHGCGNAPWSSDETKTTPVFSNTPDSHLSSLGKYALRDRGWSSFGININYKLHGLETTNSNAFDRTIVFHSWEAVDDEEIYPYGTAEGWGCPAVSNDIMTQMDAQLRQRDKPVLFWIYNN